MLWVFGDSFSQGCYEGGYIRAYGSHIAEKLDQEYRCRARYGMSFEDINATITKHLCLIKSGDTVIVGGTVIDRIMFPVPYDQIAAYHGTNPHGNFSLTGINYTTLDFFFNAWGVGDDTMKQMGYKYKKGDYSRLIFDYTNLLKDPFRDAYIRFYNDWFNHWRTYFKTIDVPFYWWDYGWWSKAPKENIGKCGHWDKVYHEKFANLLFTFMESNSSGCFKSTTVI